MQRNSYFERQQVCIVRATCQREKLKQSSARVLSYVFILSGKNAQEHCLEIKKVRE